MNLAFPSEYVAGAPALQVLVLGAAAFALFVITAAAHSGGGRPVIAAKIAGAGLIAVIGLNVALVRYVGLSPHIPLAAASATSIAMLLVLALSVGRIHQRYGSMFRLRSLVRTAVSGCGRILGGAAVSNRAGPPGGASAGRRIPRLPRDPSSTARDRWRRRGDRSRNPSAEIECGDRSGLGEGWTCRRVRGVRRVRVRGSAVSGRGGSGHTRHQLDPRMNSELGEDSL